MTWKCRLLPLAAAGFIVSGRLFAQDAAPAPETKAEPVASAPDSAPAPKSDLANQVGELRKAVETQKLQIEMLTRELSSLRQRLDGGTGPAPASAEAKPAPPSPPEVTPAAPATKDPKEPDVQRAEATGGGIKHIVAKGETLTSIAKQYNIAVATLQKANRIQDGRKLQIGVVLTIPSTPESPEKKEKP
jgi:LysM repeat protein